MIQRKFPTKTDKFSVIQKKNAEFSRTYSDLSDPDGLEIQSNLLKNPAFFLNYHEFICLLFFGILFE